MEHVNHIFDHLRLVFRGIEPNIQRVNERPTNTFGGKGQDVVVGRISNLGKSASISQGMRAIRTYL